MNLPFIFTFLLFLKFCFKDFSVATVGSVGSFSATKSSCQSSMDLWNSTMGAGGYFNLIYIFLYIYKIYIFYKRFTCTHFRNQSSNVYMYTNNYKHEIIYNKKSTMSNKSNQFDYLHYLEN